MPRYLCLYFILLSSAYALAQRDYQSGYYTLESGERREGLIRDRDWGNSPSQLSFRPYAGAEVREVGIDSVTAFELEGGVRYERHTVALNRRSQLDRKLTYQQQPDLQTETLFLNVLVDGAARLLVYRDRNLERFYFSVDDDEPALLVYKPFLTTTDRVAYNTTYRQQLLEALRCDDITFARVSELPYKADALISLFLDYNECVGTEPIDYSARRGQQGSLRISVRPGVRSATVDYRGFGATTDVVNFGRETAGRLGVELQFVLPFRRGRWSVTVEPTVHTFSQTGQYGLGGGSVLTERIDIDYTSVELPLGVRYVFLHRKAVRAYVQGMLLVDLPLGSQIDRERGFDRPLVASSCFGAAVGAYVTPRLSVEARRMEDRNLLGGEVVGEFAFYGFWGLVVGYRVR